MAGSDLVNKKLWLNVGLAALAGFVSSFAAFLQTTPKPTSTAAIISASVAAAWGAVRLAAGLIAAAANKPISVDQ